MKRKRFFIKIKVESGTIFMEIDATWERSWVLSRKGIRLSTTGGRKIYFRDALINHLSEYFQKLYDSNCIKFYNEELRLNPNNEDWSIRESLRRNRNKIHESLPAWSFPKYEGNYSGGSAAPLNMLIVLHDFLKEPHIQKAINVAKTSSKFGL
jgi:hypothetical protein